ncbi:MAG: glycogen synthase [Candidatus Limnocylindrales bacterium]
MHIVMVASECEPFAKTGGLADVVDALARALGARGHRVDVVLPFYRGLQPPAGPLRRRTVSLPVGLPPGVRRDVGDLATVDLVDGDADGYRLRLVDHPFSFDRPGYYGQDGRDFPDNAARFALLGAAALEGIRLDGEAVDVLHGHDWQAGPLLLATRAPAATLAGSGARAPATVLTCHNLAYHGWTPREQAWQLGPEGEKAGDARGVDLLREAIGSADLVNTVSPTYARESRHPEYGAGTDDLLRALGDRYLGILNGIDQGLWDPAVDPALPAPYSAADRTGKAVCRADLAERHGLDPAGPILGLVGRLDPQKGFDLLAGAAGRLVEAGARLIVLGTGDRDLVAGLQDLGARRPGRVVVLDRFDRDGARRIYGGADAFLMPSRFEPSGQGQMIALRYGTVPIVRATGGLADTIVDADADPGAGNGFSFGPPDADALLDAGLRALAAFAEPARWAAIVARGMAEDHSWARPAAGYEAMYERALTVRAGAG